MIYHTDSMQEDTCCPWDSTEGFWDKYRLWVQFVATQQLKVCASYSEVSKDYRTHGQWVLVHDYFHPAVTSYLEGAHQGFIHAHHAAGVVELPAVVGSWEQSHQLPLGKELITIFYHLGASHTQFLHRHHHHLIWTSLSSAALYPNM